MEFSLKDFEGDTSSSNELAEIYTGWINLSKTPSFAMSDFVKWKSVSSTIKKYELAMPKAMLNEHQGESFAIMFKSVEGIKSSIKVWVTPPMCKNLQKLVY